DMLNYLNSSHTPLVMILNKVDKLSNSESADLVSTLEAAYPGIKLILHSSITGKGRGEILETISKISID
ncbi:MAG: hypothetical protein PHC53_05820, partial [Patescibacteria group bacterium]|nr:hypothetical protein [Patescibacteria group bacterium]MDD5726882.1 hypothetical protein [Patescibacteria group bacterium]